MTATWPEGSGSNPTLWNRMADLPSGSRDWSADRRQGEPDQKRSAAEGGSHDTDWPMGSREGKGRALPLEGKEVEFGGQAGR